MATTTYTFHSAYNHSVVGQTTSSDALKGIAMGLAATHEDEGTKRFYVCNGSGIVAAILTRNGAAHEILRDDYMQFKDKALAARAEKGIL